MNNATPEDLPENSAMATSAHDSPLPDVVAPSLGALVRLRAFVSADPPTRTVRRAGGGSHTTALRGRGVEFEELRDYRSGDDPRSIDWRVTARTGRVQTRVYREERERPLALAVDLRADMAFATRGSLKSAQAARVAALLAWRAAVCGDRLAVFVAGSDALHVQRSMRGDRAVKQALQLLSASARSALGARARGSHLPAAVSALMRTLRPGAHVCVITDNAGLAGVDDAAWVQLRRQADVAVICVHDPLEETLPDAGTLRFRRQDLSLGSVADFVLDSGNAAVRNRWREHQAALHENNTSRMRRLGIRMIRLSTTLDAVALAAALDAQRAWN